MVLVGRYSSLITSQRVRGLIAHKSDFRVNNGQQERRILEDSIHDTR